MLTYFRRLERDGWTLLNEEGQPVYIFEKRISNHWKLIKHFNIDTNHPEGRGVYYDTHILRPAGEGEEIPQQTWEWADVDGGRLLWAENGQIWTAVLEKNGFKAKKMLLDTNAMVFEELLPPY